MDITKVREFGRFHVYYRYHGTPTHSKSRLGFESSLALQCVKGTCGQRFIQIPSIARALSYLRITVEKYTRKWLYMHSFQHFLRRNKTFFSRKCTSRFFSCQLRVSKRTSFHIGVRLYFNEESTIRCIEGVFRASWKRSKVWFRKTWVCTHIYI